MTLGIDPVNDAGDSSLLTSEPTTTATVDDAASSLIHKSLREAMSKAEGAVVEAVKTSTVKNWAPLLLLLGAYLLEREF